MSGGGIIAANTASILGMVTETQFVSESDLISSGSNFTLWNVTAVAKYNNNNNQTSKENCTQRRGPQLEKSLLKSPIFRVTVQLIKFTSLAAD